MAFQFHFNCKVPGRGFATIFKSSLIPDQKFVDDLFSSLIEIDPSELSENLPDYVVHLVEIGDESKQLQIIRTKYFNADSLSQNLQAICEEYFKHYNKR